MTIVAGLSNELTGSDLGELIKNRGRARDILENEHRCRVGRNARDESKHFASVHADGVFGNLVGGVEVEDQHPEVKQQEQGNRNDDLAVLAEGPALAGGFGSGAWVGWGVEVLQPGRGGAGVYSFMG